MQAAARRLRDRARHASMHACAGGSQRLHSATRTSHTRPPAMPREEMIGLLSGVMPMMPRDKPCHILGIADPATVPHLVPLGCDTFDSCYPTRAGRHGTMLSKRGNVRIVSVAQVLGRGGALRAGGWAGGPAAAAGRHAVASRLPSPDLIPEPPAHSPAHPCPLPSGRYRASTKTHTTHPRRAAPATPAATTRARRGPAFRRRLWCRGAREKGCAPARPSSRVLARQGPTGSPAAAAATGRRRRAAMRPLFCDSHASAIPPSLPPGWHTCTT